MGSFTVCVCVCMCFITLKGIESLQKITMKRVVIVKLNSPSTEGVFTLPGDATNALLFT